MHREAWALDRRVVFLNHGSFGACPRTVIEHQQALQRRMEADPVRFMTELRHGLLDDARRRAAAFVGADPSGFVFVPNATTGINAMLRSAGLGPGDEILVTDHGYEACRLAAELEAARVGARVTVARIPVPVAGPAEVIEAIEGRVTAATRLAIVDHVSSPTALIFPIGEIVQRLSGRGVAVIVDGAHAPGMVEVAVDRLGAAAYAGNWHKWVCAPKGAGFLWVAPEWRDRVHPVVISHGVAAATDRFHAMFDWTGTGDPTPWLTVPFAIDAVGSMLPGGWPAVRSRNRALAVAFREQIASDPGWLPTGPPEMTGSMTAHLGPPAWSSPDARSRAEEIVRRLMDRGVTVAVPWRRDEEGLLLRISAHLHTDPGDVEGLVAALADL